MASTIVGGFVCDRMNNNPKNMLNHDYKNIGIATEDVNLLNDSQKTGHSIPVKSKEEKCLTDKNSFNGKTSNTYQVPDQLDKYNPEERKFIEEVKLAITANINTNQTIKDNNCTIINSTNSSCNNTNTANIEQINKVINIIEGAVNKGIEEYANSYKESDSDDDVFNGAVKAIIKAIAADGVKAQDLAMALSKGGVDISKIIAEQITSLPVPTEQKHKKRSKRILSIVKNIAKGVADVLLPGPVSKFVKFV